MGPMLMWHSWDACRTAIHFAEGLRSSTCKRERAQKVLVNQLCSNSDWHNDSPMPISFSKLQDLLRIRGTLSKKQAR